MATSKRGGRSRRGGAGRRAGAKSAKDLGRVMGAVMKAHKADIDGNLARRIASELLPAG